MSDAPPLPWPPRPTVLEGEHVRLEPLAPSHAAALVEAIADGGLDALWYTIVQAPAAVPGWIETARAQQAAGRALPFEIGRAHV